MKRLVYLAIATLSFFNSCSDNCNEKNLKKLMGKLYKTNLVLPKGMEMLNRKTVSRADTIDLANFETVDNCVVHYFQADCDKCVNELKKAQSVISQNKQLKTFKYLFIADGPTKLYAQEAIDSLNFEYPVYYEKTYSEFKKLNKFPRDNVLYNTMLVKNGKLILLGSLFNNEKAESLYLSVVYDCK